MSTVNIVIADENQIYAKALCECLQSEYGQAFDICCLTSTDSIKDYLNRGCNADIMLLDWNLYKDEYKCIQAKMIFVLVENNGDNEWQGLHTIYKYQPADRLLREILQSYSAIESRPVTIRVDTKVPKLIAVYSAAGGSGKSTIAFHLARQYGMQGKKALLISLESYSALPIFRDKPKGRGLSYLMYLVKNPTNNFETKLDALIETDIGTNIHYIPRDLNSLEYKDMNSNDIAALIELLKKQSGFDAVIFDLDSTINDSILSMFKYSDLMVNVTAGEMTGRVKSESFHKQMEVINKLLGFDLSEKMISVHNRVSDLQGENTSQSDSESSVSIPFIKDSGFIEHGYYPELVHFKQLYDIIEALSAEKRGNI